MLESERNILKDKLTTYINNSLNIQLDDCNIISYGYGNFITDKHTIMNFNDLDDKTLSILFALVVVLPANPHLNYVTFSDGWVFILLPETDLLTAQCFPYKLYDLNLYENVESLIDESTTDIHTLGAEPLDYFRNKYLYDRLIKGIKIVKVTIDKFNSIVTVDGEKITPYLRECSVTGELINEGYVYGNMYVADNDEAKALVIDDDDEYDTWEELENSYDEESDHFYYTEWSDIDDEFYIEGFHFVLFNDIWFRFKND